MGGAVVLPGGMVHLNDWKTNGQIWKVSVKPFERIIDYQHQHSFLLHISKLLSLFNFILSQTN